MGGKLGWMIGEGIVESRATREEAAVVGYRWGRIIGVEE